MTRSTAAAPRAADQLVLQVGVADVEAEPLHLGTREVGAEAGLFETAPEVGLLPASQRPASSDVAPLRAELPEEPPDRLGATHRDDGDALGVEVAFAPGGEGLEREPVAEPLDQHDGAIHLRQSTRSMRQSEAMTTLLPDEGEELTTGWEPSVWLRTP